MTIARAALTPTYSISRILKGGWHLAGGHGEVDRSQAISDMARFAEAGITTFDCADHYTGVEAMIGQFREAYPELARSVQVQTKLVPDLDVLATVDRDYITTIIDRSLTRLKVEKLDLLQFFWWDFSIPGAVETALVLRDLKDQGKIAHLGVTNFNVTQLAQLVDAGVPFLTNQVQYSLLDRRPERRMIEYCRQHDMRILTYGQLAGGFLSETWLGRPEPREPYENRSLVKYKLIIDDFGGWERFQSLLRVLKQIGERHDVGIGAVAVRWVLDCPLVAGCIIGATSTRHLVSNAGFFSFSLTGQDHREIDEVIDGGSQVQGDCYELENDRDGRHGRIMRYNQNKG
jgi:aryl-alcohol dehydrogenase-like predicted oxidoreductase